MILCQPTFVLKLENDQTKETGKRKKVGLELLLGELKTRKEENLRKKMNKKDNLEKS